MNKFVFFSQPIYFHKAISRFFSILILSEINKLPGKDPKKKEETRLLVLSIVICKSLVEGVQSSIK